MTDRLPSDVNKATCKATPHAPLHVTFAQSSHLRVVLGSNSWQIEARDAVHGETQQQSRRCRVSRHPALPPLVNVSSPEPVPLSGLRCGTAAARTFSNELLHEVLLPLLRPAAFASVYISVVIFRLGQVPRLLNLTNMSCSAHFFLTACRSDQRVRVISILRAWKNRPRPPRRTAQPLQEQPATLRQSVPNRWVRGTSAPLS